MIITFDYSMSCPAMCLSAGPGWANSKFHYLTDSKRASGAFLGGQVVGTLHRDYLSEEERWNNIAEHFINMLDCNIPPSKIYIEGYSMGSKGRVFAIAENTAIIKHLMWKNGNTIVSVPPTTVKKFATGKGNADKQMMYEAFVKQTGIELNKLMFGDKKVGSPVTDIVDAYFIAQWAHQAI